MTSRFCKRTPTPHCIQSNLSKRCICKFSSCHNLFLPQLPGESICDIVIYKGHPPPPPPPPVQRTVRILLECILVCKGKVIFSQTSVILFTRGGVFSQHALGQTPPWADTPCPVHAGIHTTPTPPSACWDTPPTQCMLGYTPPTNACWDKGHPPPPAASAADGTHPTGMHSCL